MQTGILEVSSPEIDLYDYSRYIEELPEYDDYQPDIAPPDEQKKENWQWCNKTFINPLYASGKRSKFLLRCGNTRKCERCREAMIAKLEEEMRVGVPLYCHLISDKPEVWQTWRKWFSRSRGDCDRYWRYPMKDGCSMVVSTIQKSGDIPILQNPAYHIRKWVEDRGEDGRVSRSESMVNCSNPSCRILYLPRKKVCPECGTTYVSEKKSRAGNETAIAMPKLTQAEQGFFDEMLSSGGFSQNEWDNSPERLNGLTMEQYITNLVGVARRSALVTPNTL